MLWLTSSYISMYLNINFSWKYAEFLPLYPQFQQYIMYVAIISLFFLMAFHWLETKKWLRICFNDSEG